MADSNSYTKPHLRVPKPSSRIQPNPIKPSKSYTHFLCKSLLVALFLIVIPLFPSQAPAFTNQTIRTKLWELLHLLFVGIAVSYGLFSRRNAERGIESYAKTDTTQTCLSGILHVSSIFEDGFENPSGSNENNVTQHWNSRYFWGESKVVVTNGSDPGSLLLEDGFENPSGSKEKNVTQHWNSRYFWGESKVFVTNGSDPGSLILEDGFENPSGSDDKNVIQAWNSRYFQGESMVVVGQENYVLDEWVKPGSSIGNEPLGLPIRSLKSRIIDSDSSGSINGSRSGSGSKGSSKSSDKVRKGRIRDLDPQNLKEKFKESVVLPSPVPWRSRSGRMELREEVSAVGQSEFEPLKSRSFKSPISSRTSSISSSPKKLSPSSSVSPELPKSNMEDLERRKSIYGSSLASPTPLNGKDPLITSNSRLFSSGSSSEKNVLGKEPLIASNSRRLSNGSSSEKNVWRSFEDDSKDLSWSRREDPLGGGKRSLGSLKSDVKPATLVKASSRGKSVRTIRASDHVVAARKTGEVSGNRIDDEVGNSCNRVEAAMMENTGRETRGLDNLLVGNVRQNLDNPSPMSKPTYSKYQKGEKQEFADNIIVESEEDSESEADNFQVSSDEEEAAFDTGSNAGADPNEVDKKAGEFIAKFREQIRLQKLVSVKGSSRQHIGRYFSG